MKINRILIPTDFSAGAEQAYLYALALAAEHEAVVRLMRVLALYEPELYGSVQDTPEAAAFRQRVEASTEEQLADLVAGQADRSVQVQPIVRHNLSVTTAILEEAETWGADLIVVGTHGRGGVKHLLLGSVAEEVVRRAPVPVLLVRGRAPERMAEIERILAPTDFSEHAARALRVARTLAARYDAVLDLLHVVEPIPFPASMTIGSTDFNDYLPDLRATIHEAMEQQWAAAGGEPGEADLHISRGHAAHTIVDVAEEHDTDLIVMATQGRSGLARFFLGSVAERVVHTAPCSVLVVRTVTTGDPE